MTSNPISDDFDSSNTHLTGEEAHALAHAGAESGVGGGQGWGIFGWGRGMTAVPSPG